MRRRSLREPEACSWSTPDLGPTPAPAGPIKPQPTSPKRTLPPEVAALIRKIGLEAYYNHSTKDGSVRINGKYLYVSPLTVRLGVAPACKSYNQPQYGMHAGRALENSARTGRAKQGTDVTPAQGATPGGVGVGRWAGRPAGWARHGAYKGVRCTIPVGATGDAWLSDRLLRVPSTSLAGQRAVRLIRSLSRSPSMPLSRTSRHLLLRIFGVAVARWRAWAAAKHAAKIRCAA